MAEKQELLVSPTSLPPKSVFLHPEEVQGAAAYLEHMMEEYETRNPHLLFSILYYYVLPTLQEQLTIHDKLAQAALFPELIHSNLTKELRIVHCLLSYFEATFLEKSQAFEPRTEAA